MSLTINHCCRCGGRVTLLRLVPDYLCPRCTAIQERTREDVEAMTGYDGPWLEHYAREIRRQLFGWRPTPMGCDEYHDHRDHRQLRDYGKYGEPAPVLKGTDE